MPRREEVELAGHGGDSISAWHLAAAGDADEPGPAIVLAHEVFGLDPWIESVAARFADEGYAVCAPDLWSREGRPGPDPTDAEPAPAWSGDRIRAAVGALPDRRALGDLEAGLAWLAGRPEVDAGRMAAVGFCMGGGLAFQLGCTSRRVAAVVDFYGRVVYPELSSAKPMQPLELGLNLSCPLLAHFGEDDPSIPAADRERFRATLAQFMKDATTHVYAGAGHGFLNELRGGYHAPSAQSAWERTLAFLREALDPDS